MGKRKIILLSCLLIFLTSASVGYFFLAQQPTTEVHGTQIRKDTPHALIASPSATPTATPSGSKNGTLVQGKRTPTLTPNTSVKATGNTQTVQSNPQHSPSTSNHAPIHSPQNKQQNQSNAIPTVIPPSTSPPIPTQPTRPVPPQQDENVPIVQQCNSVDVSQCNPNSTGGFIISGNGQCSSNQVGDYPCSQNESGNQNPGSEVGVQTGNTVTIVNYVTPTPTPPNAGVVNYFCGCHSDDPHCPCDFNTD